MASISKTKPCRANLRSILTPFTKPHTHHYQHYWLTLSSLHSLWGYLKIQQLHGNWMAMMHPHSHIVASNDQLQPLHGNWMAMMHPHCHIVASNDQCQQLHGNWMAMKHPHYHIVANNDKCGSFVATDIALDNIKQSLPKCCHAIADIYIAGNDKFHSNGMCAIAGNKMAMTRPMGYVDSVVTYQSHKNMSNQ